MRLIVDTNILISSLIKDSITREILLLPFMDFYLPEFALEEVEAHKTKICKLSGLSRDESDFSLDLLLENLSIVPAQIIRPFLKEAETIIGDIDPGDIPFIVLALTVDNDGIWTNNKHFRKIKKIKVWETLDLLAYIKKI
jgi:predicted nucleic acid-binding protein